MIDNIYLYMYIRILFTYAGWLPKVACLRRQGIAIYANGLHHDA